MKPTPPPFEDAAHGTVGPNRRERRLFAISEVLNQPYENATKRKQKADRILRKKAQRGRKNHGG